MTERERFESWARQRWVHHEDFDQRIKAPSKYNNYEVQAAWEAWQERAAQPAPSVPEGWKLVPIEPTPGMMRAALCALVDTRGNSALFRAILYRWIAMIYSLSFLVSILSSMRSSFLNSAVENWWNSSLGT